MPPSSFSIARDTASSIEEAVRRSFVTVRNLKHYVTDELTINEQISDGKITEEGTHEELLEKNGLYADLWRTQNLKKA